MMAEHEIEDRPKRTLFIEVNSKEDSILYDGVLQVNSKLQYLVKKKCLSRLSDPDLYVATVKITDITDIRQHPNPEKGLGKRKFIDGVDVTFELISQETIPKELDIKPYHSKTTLLSFMDYSDRIPYPF